VYNNYYISCMQLVTYITNNEHCTYYKSKVTTQIMNANQNKIYKYYYYNHYLFFFNLFIFSDLIRRSDFYLPAQPPATNCMVWSFMGLCLEPVVCSTIEVMLSLLDHKFIARNHLNCHCIFPHVFR
jgi:hypothetical protein